MTRNCLVLVFSQPRFDHERFSVCCPLALFGIASYPVLVHRPAVSLHASSLHSVTLIQLRFAPFAVINLRRDSHPQECPCWARKKNGCPTVMVEAAVCVAQFLRFFVLSGGRRQRFFLGKDDTGLVEDKVNGVLGLGRRGEDGLAVILEDLQPVVDVFRMAHVIERDAGLCAQEGGADLGHQFLEGIAEITEAGAEHPVQSGRVPGPVADLVKAGGVVEVAVLERGPVRQEHQVRCGQVTGLVAAMLQLRQGQHPLRPFVACSPAVPLLRVHRWQVQPLALLHVEHRVAAGKGDLLPFLIGIAGGVRLCLAIPVPGGQELPENDGRALLALAHTAAQLLGIAEGEPTRVDMTSRQRHQVEQEHVHPPVRPVGERIAKRPVVNRAPRLGPGIDAVLQGGDDLAGDLLVNGWFVRLHDLAPSVQGDEPVGASVPNGFHG